MIFVGGTCGSVHAQTFNDNLEELGVSSPNEILSGKDSCMSCLMHKIQSCVHTLRRDQQSEMGAGTGKACGRSFPRAKQLYMRFGEKRWGRRRKGRLSCLMHRIRSYAHTWRRDRESGVSTGAKIGLWKKLFKGWTVSYESWSEAVRWTAERRTASRRRRRAG